MDLLVEKGNFKEFGVYIENESAMFTFDSKGKEPSIILYDIHIKSILETIIIPKAYKRGDVCSVKITGINYEECCYNYALDGVIIPDIYSKKIIGRESYGIKPHSIYNGFSVESIPNSYFVNRTKDLVIYKLHLRGLTANYRCPKGCKGNYNGLLKYLSNIKDMGFNAIELFPIYEFDELGDDNKINYWGYGDKKPFYLSPKSSYFGGFDSDKNARALIDVLHKGEISVICEFCFSGKEFVSEDYIIQVIRYWSYSYGIDGFRFIGKDIPKDRIIKDPYLKNKILIFEDQVEFQDNNRVLLENDDYLYALRSIQNHMDGNALHFCQMISSDINRVNYVAASNGFTLYDSYSYQDKHNENNLEDNKDGNNYSLSVNCGIEGVTNDKAVINKRLINIRSALILLLLSRGIPLINAGDEMLNTSYGNNNPYCQDNEIGWVIHSRKKDALELKEFLSRLIEFRKVHPVLNIENVNNNNSKVPFISFHTKEPWAYNFDGSTKVAGVLYNSDYYEDNDISIAKEDVMVIFNFYNSDEEVKLPNLNKKWYLVVNSSDSSFYEKPKYLKAEKTTLKGNTVSILIAK